MPHRIKLALVVATACASMSCLNARVRVPIKVAPANDSYDVKLLPKFPLAVYRADVCDKKGEGCKDCPVDKNECWIEQTDLSHPEVPLCASHKDKEADTNLVARETTSLDGTASFDLLPGNYELCSEVPAQFGERKLEWGVPFRVEGDGWEVAHRDPTHGWVYQNETGNVSESQLVLSNDNGFWYKLDAAEKQEPSANQTAATDRAATAGARPH